MGRIIYIPLENLKERYTIMMNKVITQYADKVLYPDVQVPDQIQHGQFLDVAGTIRFKSAQLEMIASMFLNGNVREGDVFLVGDIFFPGIESIRYMSELLKIKVKIVGFNYAGRADETDFVQQLGSWADYSENGYHEICDLIFVGSHFHAKRVVDYFDVPAEKIKVTGYIWDRDYVEGVFDLPVKKEPIVIWPHRPCSEKGVEIFLWFAKKTKRKIVVTSCGRKNQNFAEKLPSNVKYEYDLSKADYYKWLSRSEFYLSTAYQETFGYTLQEAIHFNCKVLVPNRACYPEMVPESNLYNSSVEIEESLSKIDTLSTIWTEKWNHNINQVIDHIKQL